MRKLLSLLLAALMAVSGIGVVSAAPDGSVLQYEYDFSQGALYWVAANGASITDGRCVFPEGWSRLSMGEVAPTWENFTLEYDLTPTAVEVPEGDDLWCMVSLRGCDIFFRVLNGTLHALVGGQEIKISDYKLVPGQQYSIRVLARDKNIIVYAKKASDANFAEVGAISTPTVTPGPIYFTQTYPAEIDNIKVYVDQNQDLTVKQKILQVPVNESMAIEITNAQNAALTWSSSNTGVATVDEAGNVTGVATGFAVMTASDANGQAVETCGVYVYNPTVAIRFNSGNEMTLYEGESKGLTITPSPTNAQVYMEWTTDNADAVEIYGTSFLRRAITAKKAGTAAVTATEKNSGLSITCNVTVLPASEKPVAESGLTQFYLSGNQHKLSEEFNGFHIVPKIFENPTAWESAFSDLHIQNYRSEQMLMHNHVPDDNWQAILEQYDVAALQESTGTRLIFVAQGSNNLGEMYSEDEIIEQIKYVQDQLEEPIIVELGNEVYAIAYESEFPTAKDYFEWAKSLAERIKTEIRPDIDCIAVAFDFGGESDILSDPAHQNALQDDWAYTQAHRVDEWNRTAYEYKDYFDGMTVHSYYSVSDGSNMSADEFLTNGFVYNNDTYYSVLNIYYRLGESFPLYLTEYGSLAGEMFWGTNTTDEDKRRLQWQTYPGIAIRNMEQLLNYAKSGVVQATDFHDLHDSQGFQVYQVEPSQVTTPMPNYHVFKEAGEIIANNPVFYDLKGQDAAYKVYERPTYNGDDINTLLDNVSAWGFGDESGVKEAVFINHTNAPQTVSLAGATMKPTWSYGGTIEEMMPEYMRNDSLAAFNTRVQDLPNAAELMKAPEIITDAAFAETVELPPYTAMTVEISGAVEQRPGSTAGKITKIAEYHLNHATALYVGKSKAYVDNAEVQIDPDNAAVVPVLENDRTLVPLRFIAESFGCEVSYDGATQGITIQNDDFTVNMTVGKAEYTVNGEPKTLDVPAQLSNDRTLVPLRAVSEALDKEVFWQDGLIVITNPKAGFVTELEWNNEANQMHIDSVAALFEE